MRLGNKLDTIRPSATSTSISTATYLKKLISFWWLSVVGNYLYPLICFKLQPAKPSNQSRVSTASYIVTDLQKMDKRFSSTNKQEIFTQHTSNHSSHSRSENVLCNVLKGIRFSFGLYSKNNLSSVCVLFLWKKKMVVNYLHVSTVWENTMTKLFDYGYCAIN